jgi:hypothetical protein
MPATPAAGVPLLAFSNEQYRDLLVSLDDRLVTLANGAIDMPPLLTYLELVLLLKNATLVHASLHI